MLLPDALQLNTILTRLVTCRPQLEAGEGWGEDSKGGGRISGNAECKHSRTWTPSTGGSEST